jgi:chromosome segregation ATPase
MQFIPDWSVFGLRTALLLGAFAVFAWALVSARRQAAEAHAQLAARLETALGEIRRLSGQVVTLGGSIESLATQLIQAQAEAQAQATKAQTQAQTPAPRTTSSAGANTRGYETAIRMARGGSSVEEIVASCGTTRAEAKLLRRLHECGEPRRADSQTMRTA